MITDRHGNGRPFNTKPVGSVADKGGTTCGVSMMTDASGHRLVKLRVSAKNMPAISIRFGRDGLMRLFEVLERARAELFDDEAVAGVDEAPTASRWTADLAPVRTPGRPMGRKRVSP